MPVRPLCPELAEKARVELNEDPQRLEDGLRILKEWIAKQPHLRARTDDQWLVGFLRGSKYSLERAKEKIDLYYWLRSSAPEFYCFKYTDPRFMEILDLGFSVVLPKSKNPTDPIVMLGRPGVCDPAKYAMHELMAVDIVKHKLMQLEDDTIMVNGIVSIMDMQGVTMAHFSQMTPTLMKKMVVAGQDASPFRMKGSHYLNTPPGFETLFNFVKKLLNEKNRNREFHHISRYLIDVNVDVNVFLRMSVTQLHVHNKNYEGLYKFIPREILPAEYGGEAGTIAELLNDWKEKIQNHSDWLNEEFECGTDESKRPGKPKTAEDMFGIDGSFRQLEFD